MKLSSLGWDNSGWWSASVVKEGCKSHANSSDIVGRNAKGGSGKANLSDKVADLSTGRWSVSCKHNVTYVKHLLSQSHELVDIVLATASSISRESRSTLHGAAKQDAKVLVKVGKKSVLSR